MNNTSIALAKLAGILKTVETVLPKTSMNKFSASQAIHLFSQYEECKLILTTEFPALYSDLPTRMFPPVDGVGMHGEKFYRTEHLRNLANDINYIFEVWASSGGFNSQSIKPLPKCVFISHGRSKDWLSIQQYLEKDVNLSTLELAQEPSQGKAVIQKLDDSSNKCSYAVIIMSGDDEMMDGTFRARENVIHEIGFFQGKYGLNGVCILHEEGTNIPSNVSGIVYVPYPKGTIEASFGTLRREIESFYKTN